MSASRNEPPQANSGVRSLQARSRALLLLADVAQLTLLCWLDAIIYGEPSWKWFHWALLIALPPTYYLGGLYDRTSFQRVDRWIPGLAISALASGTLIVVVGFYFGRSADALHVTALGVTALISFPFWRIVFERYAFSAATLHRVLPLVDNTELQQLSVLFSDNHDNVLIRAPFLDEIALNNPDQLVAIASEHKIHVAVVGHGWHTNPRLVNALISLRAIGVRVIDLLTAHEEIAERLPLHLLSANWIAVWLRIDPPESGLRGRLKRGIDVVGTLALAVVLSPPTILAMLLIYLDDGGPVIYRQKRVGLNGRIFSVLKLRTMRIDAEANGAQWALERDNRVTKFGNFLRRSRLDEVPQLLNVLRGEMSLVGPRPERPEFTSLLGSQIPFYDLRHLVKPGLSGWAQVSHPYGASVDDSRRKLEYDLYYVHHAGPLFDLRILAKTVRVVLLGFGSR